MSSAAQAGPAASPYSVPGPLAVSWMKKHWPESERAAPPQISSFVPETRTLTVLASVEFAVLTTYPSEGSIASRSASVAVL